MCYYSSFRVVRIPEGGRYGRMRDQIDKLHRTITDRCHQSFMDKQRARMLSNADQLNTYIQCAFDHFARRLERPFDFVEVSLKNHPIPRDLGGHILQLAIAIQRQCGVENGAWIFERLSTMVASCVLLDCRKRPGKIIVPQFKVDNMLTLTGLPKDLIKNYQTFFDGALQEFCDMHWPCDFKNNKGQCINVSSRHNPKGHQNRAGKIIAAGTYESKFRPDRFRDKWHELLVKHVHKFQNEARDMAQKGRGGLDGGEYLQLHLQKIVEFYQSLGPATKFISHSTCFCCLMQVPEHPLQCGHIICTACVKNFGTTQDNLVYHFLACPLHPGREWEQPTSIKFKPSFAGSRILCLDG